VKNIMQLMDETTKKSEQETEPGAEQEVLVLRWEKIL